MTSRAILASVSLPFDDRTAEARPEMAWPPAPGSLVSLWDMLRFQAHYFTGMLSALERIEGFLDDMTESVRKLDIASETRKGSQQLSVARKEAVDQFHRTTELVRESIGDIETACRDVQLSMSLAQVERIRFILNEPVEGEVDTELVGALRQLRERIQDELRERVFLSVPPDQARYHNLEVPPFGEAVQNKFSHLGTDITEASLCMGCGRWTAAVFHLMRIMEGGLRRLAKVVGVTLGTNPNWGTVLQSIDAAIKVMPNGTAKERAKKEKCAEVYVYLNHVKNAWRNPVMHVDRIYTEEEAKSIYGCVRSFMAEMAKLR